MKMKPLSALREYDLNHELRTITDVQVANLKEDLTKNGQKRKLRVLPDGTVLGGNHRLKAMKELGWTEAAVDEIDIVEENGEWFEVEDGVIKRQRPFANYEQACFLISTDDNDPGYATYKKEALLTYADAFHVDYHDIRFSEEFTSLAQIENIVAPTVDDIQPEANEAKPKKYEIVVHCANDVEQQEQYQKLVELGYNCIKR